jgi:ABC-type multidrug transport system fused ATPase/permease subunit
MDKEGLSAVYQKRIEAFEALHNRQKRILLVISILRLLVIIAAVYFLVLAVKSGLSILIAVTGLMVVLFIALVSFHKNQNDRKKLLHELIGVNREELKGLDNDLSEFRDGREFIDSGHPWSYDLDLFGEGSLFQYINRTATHTGPARLAARLREAVTDEKEIITRQEVTRELTGKINLRQHFAAHARLMEKDKEAFDDIIRWSGKEVFIEKYRWTRIAAWVMTAISSAIIVAGIFVPGLFRLLIPVILVNLSLLSPFLSRTNSYQARVSKKHNFLKTYAVLLELLSAEDFSHSRLRETRKQCASGSKAIDQLSGLLNLFDHRLNLLVGFTLNALFLFDFYMLHRLAKWNRAHTDDLGNWLDITGEMDARFSLSNFAYNHDAFTYPEINNDMTGMKAVALGHPMIPSSRRVDNSIEISAERVVLITGANMAGKSTFLRAVGVNMVLAYAGSPVCAEYFSTSNYLLYSSMRTSDSLKDDESYFFAEIKRLKRIVEMMQDGTRMLILLDEVLKGTNTTDKQKGSVGLIKKSIGHEVLCFIATHDLSLGELQDEHRGKIVNYCFESYIRDLALTFDYKMRPGLAKNMNASFLMKQMGIMD